MTVTIISWYWVALLRAIIHVNKLLTLVFASMEIVFTTVYLALITFFMGTGATRFLLNSN